MIPAEMSTVMSSWILNSGSKTEYEYPIKRRESRVDHMIYHVEMCILSLFRRFITYECREPSGVPWPQGLYAGEIHLKLS